MRRPGAGLNRRGAVRGIGGGGAAPLPVNLTLPTIAIATTWAQGNNFNITAGTWSGSPTLTYTLLRDGVAIAGVEGVSLATAEAYDIVAADIGPEITVREIPNGDTGAAVDSTSGPQYVRANMLAETGAAIAVLSDVGVTGDPVTEWADQVQSGTFVPGSAPDFNATGFDGNPGLVYNGTANYLVDASIASDAGDRTFYVAQNLASVTAALRVVAGLTAAGVAEIYVYQHNASGNVSIYDGAAIRDFGVAATTGPQIMTYACDSGTGMTAYRDGTQIGTAACGTLDATDGMTIGRHASLGSQFLAGTLAAIVVFDALHDSDTRARVEAYLAYTFLSA